MGPGRGCPHHGGEQRTSPAPCYFWSRDRRGWLWPSRLSSSPQGTCSPSPAQGDSSWHGRAIRMQSGRSCQAHFSPLPAAFLGASSSPQRLGCQLLPQVSPSPAPKLPKRMARAQGGSIPCPRTGLEHPTPFSDCSTERGEEGEGTGTPGAPPAPPRSPPQAPSRQHPRSPAISAGRVEHPCILPASDTACCSVTATGPASGQISAAALRSLHQQNQPCP